jgi:hypothetical protein
MTFANGTNCLARDWSLMFNSHRCLELENLLTKFGGVVLLLQSKGTGKSGLYTASRSGARRLFSSPPRQQHRLDYFHSGTIDVASTAMIPFRPTLETIMRL